MPAYVTGLAHDVYVSFAPVDNGPAFGGHEQTRWVSCLVGLLRRRVDQKLGLRDAISVCLPDRASDRGAPFPQNLQEAVRSSALLLVVMSERYLATPWCDQERAQFVDACGGGERARGRIYLVHRDEVPPHRWPGPLRQGVLGYRFFDKAGPDAPARTLGEPKLAPDERLYFERLDDLRSQLAARLREMRAEAAMRGVFETSPSPAFATAPELRGAASGGKDFAGTLAVDLREVQLGEAVDAQREFAEGGKGGEQALPNGGGAGGDEKPPVDGHGGEEGCPPPVGQAPLNGDHKFDLFLSHNSRDKPQVRELAGLLKERQVKVWLDEDEILPGQSFADELIRGFNQSACVAVLIGANGEGPWHNAEMKLALDQAFRDKKSLIPILLPGCPGKPALTGAALFLSVLDWVDFSESFNAKELDSLVRGIRSAAGSIQPSVQPPILLAETTESVFPVREQMHRFLHDQGFRVLPEVFDAVKFQPNRERLDRDVQEVWLGIQLLGWSSANHDFEIELVDKLRAAAKPVLRWRSPDLKQADFRDQKHYQFVFAPDVKPCSLTEFQSQIMAAVREQELRRKEPETPGKPQLGGGCCLRVHQQEKPQVARDVWEWLQNQQLPYDTNREDMSATELADLVRRKSYDAFLLVYGDCPTTWANRQVEALRDALLDLHDDTDTENLPACAVYTGPPPAGDKEPLECWWPALHVFDETGGKRSRPFLTALHQRRARR